MNREQIIQMAQEAGWTGIYSQWVSPTEREHLTVPVTMEQIERFAALVAAAEREALENIDWATLMRQGGLVTWGDAYDLGDRVVEAIRARGQA